MFKEQFMTPARGMAIRGRLLIASVGSMSSVPLLWVVRIVGLSCSNSSGEVGISPKEQGMGELR